jgi:hypothetical protein
MVVMKGIRKQRLIMGRIAKSRIFFCSMLCILLVASCEQRDPQTEYELLRETVFPSPREGENAAQEYIDYFHKNKKARIAEVSEMRRQYQQIGVFTSITFNSYVDFLNQTRELNKELSRSDYFGVRKLWSSLYGDRHDRLLGELMDSILETDFDDFFKKEVWKISEREFLLGVESIDQVSLSMPTLVNNGTAKKASGEYRVHLRGKDLLGWVSRTALVSVEGTIGTDASGNLASIRTGYQILKRPSLLPD